MITKEEIQSIKSSIDFSKYPTKSTFTKRSNWAIHQLDNEARMNGMSYGKYVALLYMKKLKRPKEALYAEAFIYNDINLEDELETIKNFC